jgi:hypothetical protein
MRNILILTTLIFAQMVAFTQVDEKSWILYKSIEGVEIYTQEIDCRTNNAPAQKAIIVKVVNRNNQTVKVEWDLSVWYNYEKLVQNVKAGENHYSTDLTANQSVEGNCDAPYGAFYIFKDFITYVSPTKLTQFELENIRITKF